MEISLENSSDKEWIDGETKKKCRKPVKYTRRFQEPNANIVKKILTNLEDFPVKNEVLKIRHAAHNETIYRPTSNSMYIPTITAEMIRDDGSSITLQTTSEEYFKYTRARQTTKIDHAEPTKVLKLIAAVRKRPIIWDQRLVCHKNSVLVRHAWQQLNIELGLDEKYPLTRRKKIWKSKKDYYGFAYKTGSLRKWIFANALAFYEPMINFRTTVCLRPSVSTEESCSSNLFDKLVLANKNIQCSPLDKTNVLTLVLKSLFDVGMTDIEMMEKHGEKILKIFDTNQQMINAIGSGSSD